MKTHTVHFLPADISVEVEEGATIAEAAQRVDVFINNLCGGEGVCGRCRVQVLRGRAEAEEHAKSFFSPDEITKGYVLACQTRIHDDLEVVIPPESRMEDSKIMIGGATQETGMMELRPIVKKIYLELPPPTSEDNVPDLSLIHI